MNPRYVAYARAHGCSPEDMLKLDEEHYPGGRMAGFITWVSERWADWRVANDRPRDAILSSEDHASFDAWLESFVDGVTIPPEVESCDTKIC